MRTGVIIKVTLWGVDLEGPYFMRLEEKKNLLLSDTMIPDLFITEYMLGLSAAAIRCYLYLVVYNISLLLLTHLA